MRKNELRARIGDFGVARFDECEVPCLVIGQANIPNYYKFVYWDHSSGRNPQVVESSLPRNRLIRANFRPEDATIGSIKDLKISSLVA